MKKNKRLLSLLLMIIISLFFGNLPTYAAENEDTSKRKTVKVGFYRLPGFWEVDSDGAYSGYGYDYLQEIAIINSWEYEYVEGTFDECIERLKNCEIDIMGPIKKADDHDNAFLYSDFSMGNMNAYLYVNSHNTDMLYENLSVVDGKKVGALKCDSCVNVIEEYADKNSINFNIERFTYPEDLIEALNRGSVDMALLNSLCNVRSGRMAASLGTEPWYFAASKVNYEITEELDRARNIICVEKPNLEPLLYERYYSRNGSDILVFTDAEKEYIRDNPVITAVYDPQLAPIEYFDSNTNSYKGISRDLLDAVGKKSGIKFEYVNVSGFSDALRLVREGEIQLITSIIHDYKWANSNNLSMTTPFMSVPMSMIINKHRSYAPEEEMTLAMPKDFFSTFELIKEKSEDKIVICDNLRECLIAVRNGEADAAYMNRYVAEYLLKKPEFKSLQSTGLSSEMIQIAIGINHNVDTRLLGIINKTINSLSYDEWNAIVLNNIMSTKPESLEALLYYYPVQSVIIVVVCLGSIILALVIIIHLKNSYNKKTEDILYNDVLTGYGNYNSFLKRAEIIKQNATGKYAILYIDIDNFKYINEIFGYEAGNEILKNISSNLDRIIEEDELFTRETADNFILMLKYVSYEQILARVEIIRRMSEEVMKRMQLTHRLVMPCGIYIIEDVSEKAEYIVNRARYANKQAKTNKNSGIVFYNSDILEQLKLEKELEADMEYALKNHEFEVYYQPQININTGELAGAEALVRWRHRSRGLLPPGMFIPLFEKNGFILKMDYYVLETVCGDMKGWIEEGKKVCPVSFNYSRMHLYDEGFHKKTIQIAKNYGISKDLLELEITETTAIENLDSFIEQVKELKESGFMISIDDYGSGYSSLNFLQKLDIDTLKLDKSLFDNDEATHKKRIIIRHMVNIAKDLNMQVICEGIETAEQIEFMKEIECSIAQGYYFAKPMPKKNFEEYFK